ncbi:hypothetical protein ACMYR2_2699 [Nitrobacter sp. TKz-YC01]
MRFARGGHRRRVPSASSLTSLTGIQSWTELRTALAFLASQR